MTGDCFFCFTKFYVLLPSLYSAGDCQVF